MVRKTIWSNYYEDVEACEREIRMEHPELSEDEVRTQAWELLWCALNDERLNLDIPLENRVIIIAELGLWDGKRNAYKEIAPRTIGGCLIEHEDFCRWYVDGRNDLCCNATHHDGTNHYMYREWKPGLSQKQKDNFYKKILQGKADRDCINNYTRSIGKRICDVYGWKHQRGE